MNAERIAAFRAGCAIVRNALALGPGERRERALAELLECAAARLRVLPEIRVHVSGSPNLGHQASSLRLVERLVGELRYPGRITVLYEERHDPRDEHTAPKLALIAPSLAGAFERDVRCGDAVVRVLPAACVAELPPAALGLSGGSEWLDPGELARAIGVEIALLLQPFHWRWSRDWLAFAGGAPAIGLTDDDVLGSSFFERAYRVRADAEPVHDLPAEPLVRYALREARRAGVATAIVYGVRDGGVSGLDPCDTLAAYVGAVVASFALVPCRALVVLFERDRTVFDRLAACAHAGVRWAAPATHAEFARDLAWLASANGRLLVLYAGRVSHATFLDALVHATLPSLFEGQTTETAAISNGVPYLHLPDVMLGEPPAYARLPETPERFAPTIEACERAAASFHRLAAKRNGVLHDLGTVQDDRGAVAELVAASVSASGELREYLGALRAYYDVRGNDKLDVALMALAGLLPSGPP